MGLPFLCLHVRASHVVDDDKILVKSIKCAYLKLYSPEYAKPIFKLVLVELR